MRSVILIACLMLFLGCTTEVDVPEGNATSELKEAGDITPLASTWIVIARENCVDVYGRPCSATLPPNQCAAGVVVGGACSPAGATCNKRNASNTTFQELYCN